MLLAYQYVHLLRRLNPFHAARDQEVPVIMVLARVQNPETASITVIVQETIDLVIAEIVRGIMTVTEGTVEEMIEFC